MPSTAGRNQDFYPHFIREIWEIVFKKTESCNTPSTLDAIQFVQYTLACLLQMRAFHAAYMFAINVCVLPTEVRGRNIKISSSPLLHFFTATSAIERPFESSRVLRVHIFRQCLFFFFFKIFKCKNVSLFINFSPSLEFYADFMLFFIFFLLMAPHTLT